ncbi:hypothetical protein [Pedobacter immunditicola]|uniref:hypothetical protein n=1 Tax=Pedobacter immunditicola TaxID=3133440 RepID=UPI0030A28A4C
MPSLISITKISFLTGAEVLSTTAEVRITDNNKNITKAITFIKDKEMEGNDVILPDFSAGFSIE